MYVTRFPFLSAGGVSVGTIDTALRQLAISCFPPAYVTYLRICGCGIIRGFHVNGLGRSDMYDFPVVEESIRFQAEIFASQLVTNGVATVFDEQRRASEEVAQLQLSLDVRTVVLLAEEHELSYFFCSNADSMNPVVYFWNRETNRIYDSGDNIEVFVTPVENDLNPSGLPR